MVAILMRMLLACVPAALILSACGSRGSDAAATLTVEAIFTAARQTISAQAATQRALTPPTATSSPTPAITPSPIQTRPAGTQSLCDNAAYVSDVTVPDGTLVGAGSTFVKTWLLQNTGTCAWTTGYSLTFQGGDQMAGMDTLVASPVPSGGQYPISVSLKAPAAPGTYTGEWQMKNEQHQPFGNVITVVITVGSAADCRRSSKVDVTISGDAGPENTTINYGDGVTVTDPNGNYAFTVPQGWSGTVTPSKAKVNPWSFFPEHRTYSNVTCDLRNENFKATAPPGV